jgi:GNAT superfamily N-acetyltransferase
LADLQTSDGNETVVIVRYGKVADIPSLRDVERLASQRFASIEMLDIAAHDPSSAAFLEDRILAQRLLIAEDRTPVGFIHFDIIDGGAYIEEVNVDPDHAGQRLGARLIDSIAIFAGQDAGGALLLSTFRDVPWNAPYYRKLGFVDISDCALTPALISIRSDNVERGLNETQRVFMRRTLP